MKKIISIVCSILLLCGNAQAGTNYCEDASIAGCWGMEDSTTEQDLSSNNEDLTVSPSDTIPLNTSDFKFGAASRDFEAADQEDLQHADGGSTEINGANAQITIVAWIKAESLPTSTNLMWIVSKYNSTGNQRGYAMLIDSANSDFITCNMSSAGTSFVDADSSTAPTVGSWEHWACVSNDTDIRIYKNGVLEADVQSYTDGLFNNTEPFHISVRTTAAFDGLIDDVAVFSRALSEAEINEIMNCGLTGEDCQGSGGSKTALRSVASRGVTIR